MRWCGVCQPQCSWPMAGRVPMQRDSCCCREVSFFGVLARRARRYRRRSSPGRRCAPWPSCPTNQTTSISPSSNVMGDRGATALQVRLERISPKAMGVLRVGMKKTDAAPGSLQAEPRRGVWPKVVAGGNPGSVRRKLAAGKAQTRPRQPRQSSRLTSWTTKTCHLPCPGRRRPRERRQKVPRRRRRPSSSWSFVSPADD